MIVSLKNEGQIQHRARLTGQLTDLKATTTNKMMSNSRSDTRGEGNKTGECKKENEGEEGTLTG